MLLSSRLELIRELETRTERVYHGVNGNPGISIPGGRQYDDYLAIGSLEAILAGKKSDDKLTVNKLAYRQKARAFAQELSLLEQNMAPADLYKAGNPAWAKGLSINQLRSINVYYRVAEEEGVQDKFERHFGELLANYHDYWAEKDIFQSLVLENK